MANALALVRKRIIKNFVIWEFTCTLSGSYTASGGVTGTPGETLNFNAATNTYKLARPKIPGLVNGSTSQLPKTGDIEVVSIPGGFTAQVEQNAVSPTPANYALRIFAGGSGAAAPAELTTATYASQAPLILAEPIVIQVTAPLKFN